MRVAAHAGLDDVGIVCKAACATCARADGGGRVIGPSLICTQGGGGGVHGRVEFQVDKLMARTGADIGQPHGPIGGKLLLDGQVVVVGDRHPEVAGGVEFFKQGRVGEFSNK